MSEVGTDKTAIGAFNDESKTQLVSQPGAEATQYAANIECPVCKTPNPPSETYCTDCGFLLGSEAPSMFEVTEPPFAGMLVTPDGIREFTLKPGENTIGRENADVLLTHNTVSRKHAKITIAGGRALIEDLGSTNGTLVSGRKLNVGEQIELTDGSEVEFGSVVLKYKAADFQTPTCDEDEVSSAHSEETPIDEETASSVVEDSQVEAKPIARLVSTNSSMVFDLFDGKYAIGRRQGANDIVVSDPYASGRHADLVVEEGMFTITDVGSTNGTLVNGVKLEPQVARQVQPGDEITIGQTVFVIEVAQ
jgi:pSer/pThr/pTyr-binding forkhead associated (FHA) protein